MTPIILIPFAPIVAYIAMCLWFTRGETYEETIERETRQVFEMNGDMPLVRVLLNDSSAPEEVVRRLAGEPEEIA